MKKVVFLSLIAGIFAFAACSQASLDSMNQKDTEVSDQQSVIVPEDQPVFELVANPDFVFSASETTLFSTFPATRANLSSPVVRKAYNKGVEINLSVCEQTNLKASKLAVHVRSAIENVECFIPVNPESFSSNNSSALAVLLQTSSAKGYYGENEQTVNIVGQPVNVKVLYGSEGLTISISGVNATIIEYLNNLYQDGLTVEVWNYYKNATSIESLRNGFNAGATVSFSENPGIYVNSFAKIPNYTELGASAHVYSKEVHVDKDRVLLYPYLDKAFTMPLDEKYWVRPALNDSGVPSKYYLFRGYKNPNDCVVKPVGVTFSTEEVNDASIPDDVETKYYVIPSDYNVVYYE